MSDTPNPKVSIETVTPEKAARYLRLNSGNRKISPDRVLRYAAEMRDGRWRLTGEAIIFDSNGQLLNGQHRLAACVEADTEFQTAVMRNADPGIFAVLDTGLARTAGQMLVHQGITYATNVASAARLVLTYRVGAIGNPRLMTRIATHQAILAETLDHLDRYRKLGPDAFRAYRTGFNVTSYMAFGVLLGEKVGEDVADAWMHQAASGVDLQAGDPRLALRNWQRQTRKRMGPVELSAWIRAWNAFAAGEPRTTIRPWYPGTPYPQISAVGEIEAVAS